MVSQTNCVHVFVECVAANKLGKKVGWIVFWLYLARCDDFAINKLLHEEVSQLDALCFL